MKQLLLEWQEILYYKQLENLKPQNIGQIEEQLHKL